MNSSTLVTGLWNINRETLTEGWSRSYQHYLDKFAQLLAVNNNLIIFGDPELKDFVFKNRKQENTQFIERSVEWFKCNEFFDTIQKIRTDSLKQYYFCQLGMFYFYNLKKYYFQNDKNLEL